MRFWRRLIFLKTEYRVEYLAGSDILRLLIEQLEPLPKNGKRLSVYKRIAFIVKGRLHTKGNSKPDDHILFWKPNIPMAVIEIKNNRQLMSNGIQQAIQYGGDAHFVYSSNGDEFTEHDRTVTSGKVERGISIR